MRRVSYRSGLVASLAVVVVVGQFTLSSDRPGAATSDGRVVASSGGLRDPFVDSGQATVVGTAVSGGQVGRAAAKGSPAPQARAGTAVGVQSAVVGTQPAFGGTVASGQVTFSGNDYISGGRSWSFSTATGDVINASYSSNQNPFGLLMLDFGWNRDLHFWNWHLWLQAPPGQQLAVGTYDGALRAGTPIGSAPGLDLSGDGRGCNAVTGTFTISQLALGANGSVDSLNATFLQHCEGDDTTATSGRVLVNVAGPPVIQLGSSVAPTGTVHTAGPRGQTQSLVSVSGTVTCTEAGTVNLTGTLSQAGSSSGAVSAIVACTPGPVVPWTISGWVPPIKPGDTTVTLTASSFDPYYLYYPSYTQSTQVQLDVASVPSYPRR